MYTVLTTGTKEIFNIVSLKCSSRHIQSTELILCCHGGYFANKQHIEHIHVVLLYSIGQTRSLELPRYPGFLLITSDAYQRPVVAVLVPWNLLADKRKLVPKLIACQHVCHVSFLIDTSPYNGDQHCSIRHLCCELLMLSH